MNIKYMLWAFRRTFKITAIFIVISFVVCLLSTPYDTWNFLLITLSWLLYFIIHVKDPKTEKNIDCQ